MDYTLIAQVVLGLLSPFLWLVKDEKTFRLLGALVPFCWSALNFTMGLMDSALILFAIGCRALTGLALMGRGIQIKTFFAVGFCGFFTFMLLKGYEDYYSLLPWFAACLTTIVQIYLSGVALRLTQSIGADIPWVVYNIANSAWGHLFEKTVGIGFNLWTVRKLLKKQKSASA